MRTVSMRLAAIATCAITGCTSGEANSADAAADPNPLYGAWRIVEVTTTGPEGSTNSSPQPGLRLIVDGHYALISVNGTAVRPVLGADATVAQRAANLLAMTAQGGGQEVVGDTIVTHAFVAKNPNVMDAGSINRLVYRISGDTLVATQVSTDAGPTENPTTWRYVRVGSATNRSPLDGAWRTVAITTTGPEGTTNGSPEPGLRIYVGGHYAQLQLNGPRPAAFSDNPTDQERVDVWGMLTANSGTFEVSGDTVRSRAVTAMNPAVMAADRPATVRTWSIQGDTLRLTVLEQAGAAVANPTTETLVRAR